MCSRAIACVTSPFPFPFKRLPHRLLGMKRYEVCIRIISFSRLNTRAQRDFSRPPARSRDWVARVTIFKERKKFGSMPFLGKKTSERSLWSLWLIISSFTYLGMFNNATDLGKNWTNSGEYFFLCTFNDSRNLHRRSQVSARHKELRKMK